MDSFTAPHLLGEIAALLDDVIFAWFASTVPVIETQHSASCGNAYIAPYSLRRLRYRD